MPKEKFFDPRKPFQSQRPETHEEWQARMGGEVLAVVRSGLYLDFRFLDMALSALNPAPDERCRVLATDGQTLYYQPQRLLQLYQENPKYLNRLYLHTIFHCVFRHLWLKGRREPQLWSLACDIAVENVIDSLQRKSVIRPLTYVRQNAYRQITAEEKVLGLLRGILRPQAVVVGDELPLQLPQHAGRLPGEPAVRRRAAAAGAGVRHRRPPPVAEGCPGAAPADAHPSAAENVAEDRGADADRAGPAG